MQNEAVFKELLQFQSSGATLACTEDNLWFNENPNYANFVAALQEGVRNKNVRGTILIATDKEIIWASGSRSVDVNGDIVTPLTTYEIGSLTKMYTASIVFQLIDEGKLSLTDRLTKFFPAYLKANAITIFDLLHMRSGIIDFANDCETFFQNEKALVDAFDNGEITDDVFLEHLFALDLIFEPGSKKEYSNTNYVLLAMIIEQITGKRYQENVQERVFAPLGMAHSSSTTFGDVTSVPEGKAGYMKEYQTARGAGDLHSNVLDLLKFNRAFFQEEIVSHEAKTAMLDFVDGYGCGWKVSDEIADTVLHYGGTNAYCSMNVVLHASDSKRRCYLFMLSCREETKEHEHREERPDESPATDNEAAQGNNEAEAFDSYQFVIDLSVKYLNTGDSY